MLVAALALLTGCGSTVQIAKHRTEQVDIGSGSLPGSQAQLGLRGDPADVANPADRNHVIGGAGATPPDMSVDQNLGPGNGTNGTTPPAAVALSGRGFTRTTITVGISDADVEDFARTIGASAITTGDTRAQVAAIVKEVNRRGGLLGRQIKLVWYKTNTLQALNNPQQVDEEACATWTQDSHVFAVVGPGGVTVDEDLLGCLAKTNTPLVGFANPWGLDGEPIYQHTYSKYPAFVNIGSMLGERFYRIAMQRLLARNFFQGWNTLTGAPGAAPVRLGIIVSGDANGDRTLSNIRKHLAVGGITPYDVVRTTGSFEQSAAQAQGAQVRFASEGITHVFGAGTTFMHVADRQQYHPRYFVALSPGVVAQLAPSSQLNGSMAESYIPALDVAVDPGPPTASTTACLKLMKDSGQTPAWGSTTWAMESLCDGFFFLQAAVNHAGVLSTPALMSALNALGSTVPSAVTWSTFLSPSQHASVQGLRDLAYRADCSCYQYLSRTNYN